MVVPPTNLLHPGREVAVGPRLLIRGEAPFYLYLEVVPLSATRGHVVLQLLLCLRKYNQTLAHLLISPDRPCAHRTQLASVKIVHGLVSRCEGMLCTSWNSQIDMTLLSCKRPSPLFRILEMLSKRLTNKQRNKMR